MPLISEEDERARNPPRCSSCYWWQLSPKKALGQKTYPKCQNEDRELEYGMEVDAMYHCDGHNPRIDPDDV